MPREAIALGARPALEITHEGSRPFLANREPLGRGEAVDLPLDREDRVHAPDRFERERGDQGQLAARLRNNVGKHEELASCMAPARRLDQRPWPSLAGVEPVEPGI